VTIRELDRFAAELRAVDMASHADAFQEAVKATYAEGAESPDAIEFLDAIRWICKQRSRSILEKIEAMAKLTNLKGHVRILDLRKFLGWD
jgi:hypothetical protein